MYNLSDYCLDDIPENLRSLPLEIKSEIVKLMQEAYEEGYMLRLKEDLEFIRNPNIRCNLNDWFKYNFGADSPFCKAAWNNNHPVGKRLNWQKAINNPYMCLPSRKQFLQLYENSEVYAEYNTGANKTCWNMRVIFKQESGETICFFFGSKFLGNDNQKFGQKFGFVHLWLDDEVSETEALSVGMWFDKDESVGDYTDVRVDKVHEPIIFPIPKTCELQVHYIRMNKIW